MDGQKELGESVLEAWFDNDKIEIITWNYIIVYKLSVFDKNTWNHINVIKQMIITKQIKRFFFKCNKTVKI